MSDSDTDIDFEKLSQGPYTALQLQDCLRRTLNQYEGASQKNEPHLRLRLRNNNPGGCCVAKLCELEAKLVEFEEAAARLSVVEVELEVNNDHNPQKRSNINSQKQLKNTSISAHKTGSINEDNSSWSECIFNFKPGKIWARTFGPFLEMSISLLPGNLGTSVIKQDKDDIDSCVRENSSGSETNSGSGTLRRRNKKNDRQPKKNAVSAKVKAMRGINRRVRLSHLSKKSLFKQISMCLICSVFVVSLILPIFKTYNHIDSIRDHDDFFKDEFFVEYLNKMTDYEKIRLIEQVYNAGQNDAWIYDELKGYIEQLKLKSTLGFKKFKEVMHNLDLWEARQSIAADLIEMAKDEVENENGEYKKEIHRKISDFLEVLYPTSQLDAPKVPDGSMIENFLDDDDNDEEDNFLEDFFSDVSPFE